MRPIQVFAALADPTRLDLFERLAATGPATATELARTVSVSRQAVAKHLTILDEVGLVERAPAGRVVGWVASVGDEWDSRLDRLRRAVDAT